MNRLIFFLVGFMIGNPAFSQVSFNTGWGNVNAGAGSATYSIGQVFYQVDTSNIGHVQGVQIPFENLVVHSDVASSFSELIAYPNPVANLLYVRSMNIMDGKLHYRVYDIQGVLILDGLIPQSVGIVDLTDLSNGTYLLKLFSSGDEEKVFTILKKD
jgi:hypothetical protein